MWPDRRLHGALVIAQTCLGLLLVLGAGMTAVRLRSLTATETGFDPAGVLTFRIGANPQRYTGLEAKAAFYESSLRVVRAPPGVERSALAAPRFVNALRSCSRWSGWSFWWPVCTV